MPETRIAVSPVNTASSDTMVMLSAKLDSVADCETVEPRRNIDVMRYQQQLPIVKFNNESLVPISYKIVRQYSVNGCFTSHLNAFFRAYKQTLKEFGYYVE